MATPPEPRPYRVVWRTITCPICGRTTVLSGREHNWRRGLKTCGRPACTTAMRRRTLPASVLTSRLAACAEARERAKHESPLAGPWETNAGAREWSLMAPDGTAYRFRNLALWLRENASLFDPADVVERPQSKAGVSTNAQVQLGKLRPDRRAPKRSWKGWTWLTETAPET